MYDLVCEACGKDGDVIDGLIEVCSECFEWIEKEGAWEGIVGRPEIRVGASGLRFEHETLEVAGLADVEILDVQPVDGVLGRWIACSSTGLLIEIDLGRNLTGETPMLSGTFRAVI